MSRAKVVAVVCPSCKGTGKSPALLWQCAWCAGERRIGVAQALRWADTSEMLGRGGYICGDHDLADMHRMVAEAIAVRACIHAHVGSPTGERT